MLAAVQTEHPVTNSMKSKLELQELAEEIVKNST